jgi:putative CocE/NonD family hydrolase
MGKVARDQADNEALLREWDQHADYDAYWQDEDCSRHFAEMKVPCFTIGSWFDFMNQGSIASYVGRRANGGQMLLLGPWLHGRLNKTNKVAELTFPENAAIPEREHIVRWFNHWLKGEENGVEKEPTVRYYVMGATGEPGAPGNVWREAKDWPPAAQEAAWYLHADGKLERGAPDRSYKNVDELLADAPNTSYASDPRQPMSIPGRSFPGAADARGFEEQSEARTFTTAPLTEPIEWTGEVKLDLYVSSTAPDTDFIARLSDVYPDGRSILVMDYPLRARYREGFDHEKPLKPGEVAELKWRLGTTSIIFNKGHRIRLTIASSGAPLYEPNNQTGGKQTMDWLKETRPAINTIWHDKAHLSRLVAPVVGK